MRNLKILLLLFCTVLFSYEPALSKGVNEKIAYPGGTLHLIRLQLKDKSDTPYKISEPEKFLSMKAIERRRRQHIGIDSTDLPISPKYLQEIQLNGGKIVCQSKWNNTVLVAIKNVEEEQRLRELPCIKGAVRVFSSPDSVNASSRNKLIKDTIKPDSSEHNVYGITKLQIEMLNGIPLHKAGYKGKGMTIAVFDGGFMNVDSIPAFRNVNIIATRDFVYPPSNCIYEELDHGTEVLSTMAINEPDIFIGTAPEADYILIRTEDGRTESMAEEDFWAAAAEYADSIGADVINSSLGYHGFDKDLGSHQYRDLDGRQAICSRSASMLASKGMILTNSAGNEGNNTWKKINCPSDASDILTVGALTAKRINTLFSSVGPSADGRVKPDVMSLGAHAAVISGAGKHTYANGTSFASPITCGMVACLWQALPQKTALEIMDLIRSSSDRFDYPDNVFGYGIPDFWKALQLGR